jgi:hypothetical protein
MQANSTTAQGLQVEARLRQEALEFEKELSAQTGKNFVGSGVGAKYIKEGNLESLGEIMKSAPASPKFEAEQRRLNRQMEKEDYEARQRNLPYDQRDDYKKTMDAAKVRANATLGTESAKDEICTNCGLRYC